ncbi:MAG: glycosyltransferase [candidate division WOR-3 bacterium]
MACSILNEKSSISILIVTTSFPRWRGDGQGVYIYGLAKALKDIGCNVLVIAMHSKGAKQRESFDGIEIIRPKYLPESLEVLRKDSAGLPHAWKKNKFARFAIIPFILSHLLYTTRLKRKVDIVHAHWTLSGFIVFLTQLFIYKPYILTVHGSDMLVALNNRIIKFFTRYALKGACFVTAPSQMLGNVVKSLGLESDRVKIVSNGVVSNPPRILNREPIILFVGSIIETKGVYVLLEAFSQIATDMVGVKLIYIGEGDDLIKLKELVKIKNLEEKVTFLGALSNEEVLDWMSRSKLLVLPSFYEGQGVVLLEAMSVGTPCVGSNTGGIPEIITNENGWLFEVGNINELSRILLEATNNEAIWSKKSNNCLEFVKKYSWENISKEMLSIYQKCICR